MHSNCFEVVRISKTIFETKFKSPTSIVWELYCSRIKTRQHMRGSNLLQKIFTVVGEVDGDVIGALVGFVDGELVGPLDGLVEGELVGNVPQQKIFSFFYQETSIAVTLFSV